MNGKVAIVTGGGGNIGSGVCRALAKAGASVVALDLDPSGADAAARAIACDVTDPAACASAVDEVLRAFGGSRYARSTRHSSSAPGFRSSV